MRKKILLCLLLSTLLASTWGLLELLRRPPQAQQAQELLQAVWQAEDYSFSARAEVELADVVTPYFELQGRVDGDDSQLSGVVLGQEVELRYHAGVLSRRLEAGAWSERSVADIAAAAELYAELLPATAFQYQGLADYSCQAEAGGWALTLTPAQALGWVGEYFHQPQYVLHCDRWGRRLHSLELVAREKVNDQATLRLSVSLGDS